MNRRLLAFAVLGLLLAAGLGAARWLDAATITSADPPIPRVVVGRDRPAHDPTLDFQDPGQQRDYAIVSCTVQDSRRDAGSLIGHSADGDTQVATGDRDHLTLTLSPGTWTLAWFGMDRQVSLGTLDLDAGDVQNCVLASRWQIAGRVTDLDNRPLGGIVVQGCGDRARSNDDGTFALSVEATGCAISARVEDGMLRRESEPWFFTPFTLVERVDLAVDTGPVGGIGVQIGAASEGVRVESVYPDTPAEDAGIAEGDVIVAVDGESMAGWTTREALASITGTPGEVVRLDVDRAGASYTFALRRERIVASAD